MLKQQVTLSSSLEAKNDLSYENELLSSQMAQNQHIMNELIKKEEASIENVTKMKNSTEALKIKEIQVLEIVSLNDERINSLNIEIETTMTELAKSIDYLKYRNRKKGTKEIPVSKTEIFSTKISIHDPKLERDMERRNKNKNKKDKTEISTEYACKCLLF